MIRILKFLWQRITRGWDDSETWGLYDRIAKFTLPRLIRLKELSVRSGGGVPLDFVNENNEANIAEWNNVLDKMIYAFERIVKDDVFDYVIYPPDYVRGFTLKPNEDGKPYATHIPNDPRPIDYSKVEEIEAKIQEGLDLFAKYFRSLWW